MHVQWKSEGLDKLLSDYWKAENNCSTKIKNYNWCQKSHWRCIMIRLQAVLEQSNKISASQERLWEELKNNISKDKEKLETEIGAREDNLKEGKTASQDELKTIYVHQEEFGSKISDTKAGHSKYEETIRPIRRTGGERHSTSSAV